MSERKMEASLQVPVMKMFAEKKKAQTLLMFNSFSKSLAKVACDCGSENRTDCWDQSSDQAALTGEGVAFCGADAASLQGGCQKVSVMKPCPTNSGSRRRLQVAEESAAISFDHISVGSFAEPLCTVVPSDSTRCTCSDKSKMDTLAVKNSVGTVIGQLLGDGQGIRSQGTFTSATTCLTFRDDVRRYDGTNGSPNFFDRFDVAKYDPASKSWTTFNIDAANNADCTAHASCTQLTAGKICFTATSSGQYFPVLKKAGASSSGTDAW